MDIQYRLYNLQTISLTLLSFHPDSTATTYADARRDVCYIPHTDWSHLQDRQEKG